MPQTHNSEAEINQGIANGRLLSMMERRREVRTLNAGRMLSPDNYVQDPGYTQNYNRYSYAWNNPLVYEDPDGDFVVGTIITLGFIYATDIGYDLQKQFLPVAMKVDIPLGTDQRGFGVQFSVGVPHAAPASVRVHGGVGYYTEDYGTESGWRANFGYEVGLFSGGVVMGSNFYRHSNSKYNQRTGHVRIGNPLYNIKYENDGPDWWILGDGGDRYRTAAAQINIGVFSVGFNLFTGDPGLDPEDRLARDGNYVKNQNGDDPDEYRAGIGYIGIGSFRVGANSETIRHKVQNELVHSRMEDSHYFKKMDEPQRLYFQYGGRGIGYLW